MKIKKHIEIEEIHLNNIYKHIPSSITISFIINELLYQLDLALAETKPNLDEIFEKSVKGAVASLSIKNITN